MKVGMQMTWFFPHLKLLRASETNEVLISSHIWVGKKSEKK